MARLYWPTAPPGREGGDSQDYNNTATPIYTYAIARADLTFCPPTADRQNGYSREVSLWAPIPTVQDRMRYLNRTAIPELQRAGLLKGGGS